MLRRRNCFLALQQLHWSFRDIDAHQDFEMPEFFTPQLLIKELCIGHRSLKGIFLTSFLSSRAYFFRMLERYLKFFFLEFILPFYAKPKFRRLNIAKKNAWNVSKLMRYASRFKTMNHCNGLRISL